LMARSFWHVHGCSAGAVPEWAAQVLDTKRDPKENPHADSAQPAGYARAGRRSASLSGAARPRTGDPARNRSASRPAAGGAAARRAAARARTKRALVYAPGNPKIKRHATVRFRRTGPARASGAQLLAFGDGAAHRRPRGQ